MTPSEFMSSFCTLPSVTPIIQPPEENAMECGARICDTPHELGTCRRLPMCLPRAKTSPACPSAHLRAGAQGQEGGGLASPPAPSSHGCCLWDTRPLSARPHACCPWAWPRPPFCYNGESSKFPFTGYCKATDINNCDILCLPKPYKYIKNKNTTATLSEKRGVTSCLGGSQLIPCVRCAGLLPAAKENKEHHPNLKSQTFWNVLPYILAAERLLKIRKKYTLLCMWQAGGTKSVCSASWNPWLSISQAPTNYLLFPFWKCMSQWLWGRSFIFNVVYSSEDRGFSTAASWDLRAPTSATEVQHWNRIIKWSD